MNESTLKELWTLAAQLRELAGSINKAARMIENSVLESGRQQEIEHATASAK